MAEGSNDLTLGYMMGQSEGGGGFGMNGIVELAALGLIFGDGFGFGGGGGRGAPATQADLAAGFNNSAVLSSLNDIKLGQTNAVNYNNQGFSGLNTALMQGFHGVDNALCTLGHQFSDCCCATQRAIDGVNYNMATQFCALGNTIQTSTRDINDTIRDGFARMEAQANARYVAELERKLNNCDRDSALQGLGTYLINTLRPSPIPAYPSCNPWANTGGNWNGCGCGC